MVCMPFALFFSFLFFSLNQIDDVDDVWKEVGNDERGGYGGGR